MRGACASAAREVVVDRPAAPQSGVAEAENPELATSCVAHRAGPAAWNSPWVADRS